MQKLYIENFSNTEFVYEKDVYSYLEKLKSVLEEYSVAVDSNKKTNKYDPWGWIRLWQLHMKDLSIELFNSFSAGNFLAAAAMTRTLMECYVFVKILKDEQSRELICEWWLCNMIHRTMGDEGYCAEQIRDVIKEFCNLNQMDYDEKWEFYTEKEKGSDGWLKKLVGKKRVGFRTLCEYIGEDAICKDYERACEFVHGQDITTKLTPFLLFEGIYDILHLMVTYIFKAIRLFNIDDEMDNQILELEGELLVLAEKYLGMDFI